MVICYFDIVSVSAFPAEAYTPLIVDPDTPLACPIAGKLFQPVAWRGAKEIKRGCAIQLYQFTLRNTLHISWQPG